MRPQVFFLVEVMSRTIFRYIEQGYRRSWVRWLLTALWANILYTKGLVSSVIPGRYCISHVPEVIAEWVCGLPSPTHICNNLSNFLSELAILWIVFLGYFEDVL